MTPGDVAAAAAEAGFRTMPLGAKLPLVAPGEFGKAFPDAHWPADHPLWESADRVGILCGPCPALEVWEEDEHLANEDEWLLCIDLDGPWKEVPTLRDFVASLPPTLTTHGGNHLFFAVPPSEKRDRLLQWTDVFRTKAEHGAAIDIKWNGGYAAEKGPWTGTADDLAEFPEAAMDAILAARRASFKEVSRDDARWDTVPLLANGTVDFATWRPGATQEYLYAAAGRWLSNIDKLSVEGKAGSFDFMYIVSTLVNVWGFGEEDTIRLIEEFYNPRLKAIGTTEWGEKEILHKIADSEREGSTQHAFLEFAVEAAAACGYKGIQEAPPAWEAKGQEGAEATDVPTKPHVLRHAELDASDLRLCPVTGLPWILQKGNRYWLKEIGTNTYCDAIESGELRVAVTRMLYNVEGIKGEKGVAKKQLEDNFIQHIKEVKYSYLTEGNTFEASSKELHVATLKWKHPAVFHGAVDRWLRFMFGKQGYPLAEQWLASFGALHRPAPMLYMDSPKNAGKTLLMRGVAKLWGCVKPGHLKDAVESFNPTFIECPLVFADESIPEGLTFAWLREAITASAQYINEKNKGQYAIEGHARYALAANGAGALRFARKGTLTLDDRAAICERLLYLKVTKGTEDFLKNIFAEGGEELKAQMVEKLIPEHIMWLIENVSLTSTEERMAALPAGGEDLMDQETAARNADILEVVHKAMEGDDAPGGYQGDLPGHLKGVLVPSTEPGELWVHAPALKAALRASLDKNKNLAQVMRDFFETYGGAARNVRIEGKQLKVRAIDKEKVLTDLACIDLV